ncbi:MAG: hypothetical protein CTY15_10985 [Methylocystis sp.]|nr:MAG: hypothetical protein CTY15_10985 [Methylocystis sp.]
MSTRPCPALRFSALLLVALLTLVASAPQSYAQDPLADFFGGLFGGGGAPHSRNTRPPPDQPRVRRIMPHQENKPPTYWRGGEAARTTPKRASKRVEPASTGGGDAAATAQAQKPEVAASYFVAVMGDTLGMLLANGLEETFADKPEIGIVRKTKESSGLVRDDFYDWQKAAKDIAGGLQRLDAAVMMIGSNDRQPLRQGGQNEEPLSPRWKEIYAARIDAVLAAFREKKIPVIWVGLPIMKNEGYSADMAKLNEIFRERVIKDGGVYVDLWESFSDERGQFSAFGPDINGQIVKLRTADGVHFTDAGALSLAHFVSNEIKKLYDSNRPAQPAAALPQPGAQAPATPQAAVTPAAPGAAAPAGGAPQAPVVFRSPVRPLPAAAPSLPERAAVGPVQPLSAAGAVDSGDLARPSPRPAPADAEALARHVFIQGGDQTPRPNRADDYSWKAAAPAAP